MNEKSRQFTLLTAWAVCFVFRNKSVRLEILIRLMSFGEFIWFDDDNDPLRIEMLRRLDRQLEIEQNLTQEVIHSDSGKSSREQEQQDGDER